MFRSALVLSASVVTLTALARADVSNGLIAHWPFDGNPNDTTSGGRHAIPNGSPTYIPGRIGLAADFDGFDDWFRVNHGGALTFDLDTQSYTIALFLKTGPILTTSDPCLLQDRYGSNHSVSYNLCFNGNSTPQQFASNSWYGGSGPSFETVMPAAPLIGAWHHMCVTFNHVSGLKSMFVDGKLVASDQRPNQPFNPGPGNTLTIAAYYGSCNCITNFFRGQIDDLRIYNRALSQCEVGELSQAASPTPAALVAGFDLDTVGAAPSAFAVRLPGASQTVAINPSGGNSLRLVAAPFSSADASSFETFPFTRGRAALSFRLRWSSQSTANPLQCNDMGVSYQGASASFGLGFSAPDGDINGPRVIAGTCIPVAQDRWYEFLGIADMGLRTVDWYVDGLLVHRSKPMGSAVADSSRRDHVELHVGCIDNGQSVALFDSIAFTPPPGCPGDYNGNGSTTVQDLFDFLADYFATCP